MSSNYRHVAISISSNIATLYLDGSAISINPLKNYPSTISKLLIGSAADLSYGFTGYIDDFKIWNRALPASDISSIYNPYTVYGITSSYISIWLDTSIASNFVLSGSNITTWKDRSSNGFNMSKGGTIYSIYNSTSPTSVLISASWLTNSSFNVLTSLQTWFFLISVPSVFTTDNIKIVGLQNNTLGGVDYILTATQFSIYSHKTNNDGIYFDISPTANTKYLISVSFNMSTGSLSSALANSIMRLNGTTQTIKVKGLTGYSTNAGTAIPITLLIGTLQDGVVNFGSTKDFNIYEIIGINYQALGINDIRIVERYLNEKWNLGYTIT